MYNPNTSHHVNIFLTEMLHVEQPNNFLDLEELWRVGEGHIETKNLTMDAPKHEVKPKKKVECSVINPSLGEIFACCIQIDEFKKIRHQFMVQRLEEGASMQQVRKEAEGITEETIKKAKTLKAERAAKKHRVLEEIEKKLPKVDSVPSEVRARVLKEYLDKHGPEIVAEAERYTLGEIQAEVELYGNIPQGKRSFHDTLLNCISEADAFESELEMHTAEGIGTAINVTAEELNKILIPGYAAWTDGGNVVEVVNSAASDIAITIVGGKIIKVAWTGSKALYQGAKALGKELQALGKVQVMERQFPYNSRTMQQILERGGSKVTSSTLPPLTAKNVKLAGKKHPETGIVFDSKGFPIFDDIMRLETRISGDLGKMLPDAHKRAVTRQLKADVLSGKVDRKMFTEIEWTHIEKGKAKIGEYTWHHHQDVGRMQLVPSKIHEKTGHFGGDYLWGME